LVKFDKFVRDFRKKYKSLEHDFDETAIDKFLSEEEGIIARGATQRTRIRMTMISEEYESFLKPKLFKESTFPYNQRDLSVPKALQSASAKNE
jgi:hypothetical protein